MVAALGEDEPGRGEARAGADMIFNYRVGGVLTSRMRIEKIPD